MWPFSSKKESYWQWYCRVEKCSVPPENTIAYSDYISEQTRRMSEFHRQELEKKNG